MTSPVAPWTGMPRVGHQDPMTTKLVGNFIVYVIGTISPPPFLNIRSQFRTTTVFLKLAILPRPLRVFSQCYAANVAISVS